jgi:hypothetical protein
VRSGESRRGVLIVVVCCEGEEERADAAGPA